MSRIPMRTENRRRPRPEPRLARKIVALDLAREANLLKRESGFETWGHDAKTLYRRSHDRGVLIVLKAGKKIPKHDIDASVVIQPLEGRLRVHLPDDVAELGPGTMLALDEHVMYDIEAKNADVTVLVTFSLCECT